jgi:radical SAM superfamily enzyme YgiQ (UPF0313 family)
MRVYLIIPPSPSHRNIMRMIDCSHEAKANYLLQPNDFMLITSHLKKTDEVIFIDGTANKLSESDFLKKVRSGGIPDLLFFALSSVCWESDLGYYNEIIKIYPDVPRYVLGDVFFEKKFRETILKICAGIITQPFLLDIEEMVKNKEDRKSLKGICTTSELEDRHIRKQGVEVKDINFPRHEIFLSKKYRFPFAKHIYFSTVTTLWGCPFSCSYCTDSKTTPFYREVTKIVEELEYIKKLQVKELFFADKVFGFPLEKTFHLLGEMSKYFPFSWSCYFHPQLYSPELLEKMKKAGCHTIIIGIDSANLAGLKKYNRNVKREKLEALIFHANKLKISVCADFIIGLEHETKDDIFSTINYSLNLPLDFASFNIATPLPGSSIRDNAIKEGKIRENQDGFDTLGNKNVLDNQNVSGKDLITLRKKAVFKFYFRVSHWIRRLSRTSSIEHLIIQLSQMKGLLRK